MLDRKEAARRRFRQAKRDTRRGRGGRRGMKSIVHQDPGNEGVKNGWAKSDLDDSDWKPMDLPKHWEDDGLKIDGAVWFRKTIDLPAEC